MLSLRSSLDLTKFLIPHSRSRLFTVRLCYYVLAIDGGFEDVIQLHRLCYRSYKAQ
jgi:hypothetical protein